jgi:hypothetical protein
VKLNAQRGSLAQNKRQGVYTKRQKEAAKEQSSNRGSKQSSAGKSSPGAKADGALAKYAQLIIYYSSVLILLQDFDGAIKVLSLFGDSQFEKEAPGKLI